jgi:Ca2+/Na+ antiporter
MDSINNINNKITKLFQNPNINFFIIMMLILIISSYTLINTSLKYSISSFVANPIIILSVLISVVLIGYYNVNIAVLVLLLLFVALYGTTIFNSKNRVASDNKNNPVEGFTDDTEKDEEYEESEEDEEDEEDFTDNESDDETDDEHDVKLSYPRNPRITKSSYKEKEDKDAKTEETVNKIKNTILGTMNNIKDVGNNEYQKSLLENKKIQYLNEKKNNRNNTRNSSKNNNNSNNRKSKNSKQNFTNTGSSSKKENFHTINIRKFDPNKEEDTNFLITKEILQDMITRIDYNYESSTYLKKYLKHRVEEIVELNKLLEDDD